MKRRETTDVSQISRRIHLVASSIHFGVQFSIIKILEGGRLGGQCGMIVRGLKIQAVNSGLKMTVENYWGRQSSSNGEWRGEEFRKPRSGFQEKPSNWKDPSKALPREFLVRKIQKIAPVSAGSLWYCVGDKKGIFHYKNIRGDIELGVGVWLVPVIKYYMPRWPLWAEF